MMSVRTAKPRRADTAMGVLKSQSEIPMGPLPSLWQQNCDTYIAILNRIATPRFKMVCGVYGAGRTTVRMADHPTAVSALRLSVAPARYRNRASSLAAPQAQATARLLHTSMIPLALHRHKIPY